MDIEVIEQKISVRGLTRGEIRQLIADGIDPDAMLHIADSGEQSAAIDKVLAIAVADYNPDDVTPAQQFDLALKVIELTYLGNGVLKKFATLQKAGSEDISGSATSAAQKALTSTGDALKAALN